MAETAAEQYARLKEQSFETFLESSFSNEALKGVELFEVKCPSGMPFKCRRLGLEFLAQVGQMPMALSAQMIAKEEDANDDGLTDEEKKAKKETRINFC